MLLAFTRLAQRLIRGGLQITSPVEQSSLVIHTSTAWTLPRPQANLRFSTVAAALQDLVQTGRLRGDKTQQFAAQVLSAIQTRVQQEAEQVASATPQPDSSLEEDKTNSAENPQQSWAMPRGAYLWGTIGSGKTMLLDLFSTSFSEPDRTNLGLCRLHFHEFMLSVHRRLHLLQQSVPRIQGKSQFGLPVYRYETECRSIPVCVISYLSIPCQCSLHSTAHQSAQDRSVSRSVHIYCDPCRYAHLDRHPVDIVAEDIASRTKVLCLDELHVSDVADALILSQVPCSFLLMTSANYNVAVIEYKHPEWAIKISKTNMWIQCHTMMCTSVHSIRS